MIGLDIENLNLKNELKYEISGAGYMVCDGYNPNLDLLIVQDNEKGKTPAFENVNVIFITCDKNNPYINICYYSMIEPVNVNSLMDVINGLNIREPDYSALTGKIMLDLGVSPMVKGYGYLKDAVNVYIGHKNLGINDIYELIGLCRNTSTKNVERNIRYAIESAFNRCRIESQERIFKNSINPHKGKPTNMEFVCRVADYIEIGKYK